MWRPRSSSGRTPPGRPALPGPSTTQADCRRGALPAAPGSLEAYPVSPLVSNVRNNGPELLEPLPLEESLA